LELKLGAKSRIGLLKGMDGSVLAFLKCTDGSILVFLEWEKDEDNIYLHLMLLLTGRFPLVQLLVHLSYIK
jgi:hypothetical protein